MRIVYVLTSLGVGGAERQVLSLASRMAARGHKVAVLVLRPRRAGDCPTDLEVTHLDLRKTPLSLARGLLQGTRFLRTFRPEVVHSHNFHGNLLARLLKLCYPQTTLISTVHNVYEGGWPRMLAYRLTDRLSKVTAAVSEAAAERYIRLKAVPRSKCVVLANAIDTVEFSPDPLRRAEVRLDFAVTGEFIWLAAGRLVPAKDYPNLVKAFAQVREAHPKAQLWIAGRDAGNEQATELVVNAKSTDGIRFLGLRSDMPALFDAADAFVLSSAWEGMPLVVAEAMAMKKPVVATDVGGVRELAGTTASIVPPGDSAALAQAMLSLMRQSSEARQSLGRAARQRIVGSFNIDTRAAEWESLYASVVQQSPASVIQHSTKP